MSMKAVTLSVVDRKTQLLLVEDDDDFRRSLTLRLAKHDYEVIPAASAEEALSILETRDVDVVVADIKLGAIDGVQLLSMVRERKNNLPVILVTGYASLDSAREAVRLEANDYLLKPLESIEQLLNPLEKAVKNYKLLKENEQLRVQLADMVQAVDETEKKYRQLKKRLSDSDENLKVPPKK